MHMTSNRRIPMHLRIIFLLVMLPCILFLTTRLVLCKTQHNPDTSLTFILWSFFPLQVNDLSNHISITSTDPRQKLQVKIKIYGKHKIRIHINELLFPKGYPINIKITKLPTIFPWIKSTINRTVFRKVKPKLMGNSRLEIGTLTTINLSFNTPLKKKGAERYITADFGFELAPKNYTINGKNFVDYSTWLIIPSSPLKHNAQYSIKIDKDTPSLTGHKMGREEIISINTVAPLELRALKPETKKSFHPLQGILHAKFNREIKSAYFTSKPLPEGRLEIKSNSVRFIPTRVFLPNNHYKIDLIVEDYFNEKLSVSWEFLTISMRNRLWVEVSLWLPQTVRVYKGEKFVREVRASGGKRATPTPRGTYTIYDRGYAFYSYKFREGAYYWVRFKGPFLFHSVPFGPNRRLKNEEYDKLGTPASHGCIRLPIDDARWFYQNIPNGTKIIIHGPNPSETSITLGQLDRLIYFRDEKELEEKAPPYK